MADSKITALTALTAADPANDMMPIVDVSDTSMAASGTTKRISINNILACSPSATLASATITGDLTVDTNVLKVDSANNRVGIANASPTVPLDVTGAAKISSDLTVTNGNVILGTSGKGIDFSTTASGSGTMTSELLNDYEEGTFTPAIIGGSTVGTGTYSTQVGRYTKVGRIVNYQIFITWSAHTGSGDMFVGGLPFTSLNESNVYSSPCIGYANNFALTASNIMTAFLGNNSTNISIYQTPVGGGGSTSVPLDTAASLMISGSYIV